MHKVLNKPILKNNCPNKYLYKLKNSKMKMVKNVLQ